jgi:hypothetical protein
LPSSPELANQFDNYCGMFDSPAYEDRVRSLQADRNIVEVLEIRNDRIERHHRHEVADADVARWADGVTGTTSSGDML